MQISRGPWVQQLSSTREGAMRPGKRPRTSTPPEPRNIPLDLVLDIVARCCDDVATVIRSAATCRALRRDILSSAFHRRVFHDATPPSCILGFLHAYDDARGSPRLPAPYSLAHPATPGAATFAGQLARFVSRSAGDLLDQYYPLTSRNGLVVLYRRYLGRRRTPELCVYDPMTGDRAFVPAGPPIIARGSKYGVEHTYVLLTAADGIGCSWLLLAADFTGLDDGTNSIMVQTVSSEAKEGTWGPVTKAIHPRVGESTLQPRCNAVVLGGVVHWLTRYFNVLGWEWLHLTIDGFDILTYDVSTGKAGVIPFFPEEDLPDGCKLSHLQLATSPDGKLLSLLVADKQRISVWLLLQQPDGDGAGWSRHAVIDTTATVKSLVPPEWWLKKVIKFGSAGARSGAILVRPFNKDFNDLRGEDGEGLLVLDMETKEMRRAIHDMGSTKEMRRAKRKKHVMAFPFEIDLKSRLSAMKTF